jgi:hypothetical protein
VSIGVATGLPTAALEKLIERADAALYRAKENGRNRVEADEDLVVPAAPAGSAGQVAAAPIAASIETAAALTVPVMVR